MRGGTRVLLAILLAAWTAAWAPVHAGKLGTHACYELRVELGLLRATGVEDDMKRGPNWAKVNLTREELEQVRRLVEVEEQLRFRCGSLRGRLVAKKPRIPEIPRKKPVSANAQAKRRAAALEQLDAKSPPKAAPTAAAQKRASLRRKKRRARAYATSPNDAVTKALAPFSGF